MMMKLRCYGAATFRLQCAKHKVRLIFLSDEAALHGTTSPLLITIDAGAVISHGSEMDSPMFVR